MGEGRAAEKKRPDLVTLIAIWQFFMAAMLLLGVAGVGVGLVAVILTTFGEELVIGSIVLGLIMLILLVFAGLNVAAGWGLLALKDWARWLSVVLGVFGLANVPIGTIVGIVKLVYFFSPEAKEAFEGD